MCNEALWRERPSSMVHTPRAVKYRKEQWAGLLASTLLALRECAAEQNAQRVCIKPGCRYCQPAMQCYVDALLNHRNGAACFPCLDQAVRWQASLRPNVPQDLVAYSLEFAALPNAASLAARSDIAASAAAALAKEQPAAAAPADGRVAAVPMRTVAPTRPADVAWMTPLLPMGRHRGPFW